MYTARQRTVLRRAHGVPYRINSVYFAINCILQDYFLMINGINHIFKNENDLSLIVVCLFCTHNIFTDSQ